MWDSHLVKVQQNDQNKHNRTQVWKEEVIYFHDIDRNIAEVENRLQAWKSLDLSADKKIYRLEISYSALSQLNLRTKMREQKIDETAINTRGKSKEKIRKKSGKQ